jgi:hypothetical protein
MLTQGELRYATDELLVVEYGPKIFEAMWIAVMLLQVNGHRFLADS